MLKLKRERTGRHRVKWIGGIDLNIFVLDNDPYKGAEMVLNKHAVKMPLESLQMMSTIADHLGFECPYKPVMLNHPCTIWARTSKQNFQYLKNHFHGLCKTYTERYDKIHKCEITAAEYEPIWQRVIDSLPDDGLTPFAQAMPDHLKHHDAVIAYRNYYMTEKRHIAQWKNEIPSWWR